MTRLVWGDLPPLYDRGVDRGVLYLDGEAHPWNGLVSVGERETGVLETDHYFDGNRIYISQVTGEFEGTISAYTYPDRFAEYNGYSDRKTYQRFGFSYRTEYGSGYKLHLVYNALIRDENRNWTTETETPSPSLFAWNIYGSSVAVPGASPSAKLVLQTGSDPDVLSAVEDILYGTEDTDGRFPDPAEIIEMYESATTLRITYNGDGSYTATGPDTMVQDLGDGRFILDAPSVFLLDSEIFVAQSY